jgi:nucleoside-diphosphate kinase
MAVERSFAMLKPGVTHRRLVGEVVSRIERKTLKIVAMRMMRLDRELVERHYAEHKGKAFYAKLVEYMVSGPVVAMVVEGDRAIEHLRKLAGPTDPSEAPVGTIRGDFAIQTRLNIIHASDSPESARREIGLFFDEAEICPWEDGNDAWY